MTSRDKGRRRPAMLFEGRVGRSRDLRGKDSAGARRRTAGDDQGFQK